MRRLPERTKDRGLRAVDAFYRHPWAPLLAAPLTALTLLPMTSGMLETPGSFARPPATLLADGVFVLAGWGLYLRREAVAALPARAWSRVLWGVALFAAWLALLVRLQAGDARAHLPAVLLLAAACWCLVLGLAGVFVRHFATPRAATRRLADASYWCYLAHLPVVAWCSVGTGRRRLAGWREVRARPARHDDGVSRHVCARNARAAPRLPTGHDEREHDQF